MKTKKEPVRVVHINKNGEEFNPDGYVVPRSGNSALYKFLEDYQMKGNNKKCL